MTQKVDRRSARRSGKHSIKSKAAWVSVSEPLGNLRRNRPKKGTDVHKGGSFGTQFPWARGAFTADGRTYKDVGFRYKGGGGEMGMLQDNVTEEVNPVAAAIEIVEVAELPAVTLTLVGDALKANGASVIVATVEVEGK